MMSAMERPVSQVLKVCLVVSVVAWWLSGAVPSAQAPAAPAAGASPASLPLIQGGGMRYLGAFTLPPDDGAGGTIRYGGNALGLGPDGTTLYYSCLYNVHLAVVTIAEPGERGRFLAPCTEVPNLKALDPSDPNAKVVGGALWWNNRLITTAYATYDAGHNVSKSHFVGTTVADIKGPFQVGNDRPGMVAGYMGVIPEEWRTLLGGPALTGQCCISIISRSSYGPSVSVFDPDEVGTKKKAASKMLVGYPDEHQTLGPYDFGNDLFSSVTMVGGVAFPQGTRSVLFIGRHGTGYCYGEGTTDPTKHLTPHPLGTDWCYDPTIEDKGPHGFPYRHMVWAYDANDLVAVKNGRKAPWSVKPYATWTLTEMSGGTGDAQMRGAVYDPARRRVYVTVSREPIVHVYEIGPGEPSPAPER
jgi:hypothetical protein